MQIPSLNGFYSEHVVMMPSFALLLSMALIYCIVPLVHGISNFASLVVEAYVSFYLLSCIVHVYRSFRYLKNDLKSVLLGLVAGIRGKNESIYSWLCCLLKGLRLYF